MTSIRFDVKHWVLIFASMLVLAACDRSAKPDLIRADVSAETHADTAEALAADSERLKELMRQCKEERVRVSDALCQTVSAAWRVRFMGDGKSHYTPAPTPTSTAVVVTKS